MTNNVDNQYAIAGADVLSALTGIVNANLADGIADGQGNVHPVSVVIWRNMGDAPKLAGEESLAVIVHVDGMSVAPFAGSTIYVRLADLSHAATFVVVRAERLAAEELDRREEETTPADIQMAVASETLAQHDDRVVMAAIKAEAELATVIYSAHVQQNSRDYNRYTPAQLLRYAGESVIYVPTPVSGDELARVRAGVVL